MFSASGSPNQQLDLHQISLLRYQRMGGLWLSATVAKTKGYIKGVADLVTDYETVATYLIDSVARQYSWPDEIA